MIALSVLDHSRSPRPSVLLNVYLSLTLILEATQARTLFISLHTKYELTYSAVFGTTVAIKAVILLLEAKQKSLWIRWNQKEHSPEETSGIFSLSVYFWLNKMFRLGYGKLLTIEDLYPLDSALKTKSLHDTFSRKMDYSKLRDDKFGLFKVLAQTLAVPFLLPIPPRLAMVAFTLSQALMMEKLLDYLSKPELDANVGYGFIGATFLIYSGIAISMAFYWSVIPPKRNLKSPFSML
jgi:hypothetical protein